MSAVPRIRLSKSKIAAFEHCPKRLWLQMHRRELGRFDAATLARFQFGHAVGAQACSLVPDGIMIAAEPDIQAAIDRTRELVALEEPVPLFEATFLHDDVLVRVDILKPLGRGQWRAIEVKASGSVKSYQVADIATQVWVMRGCGIEITAAAIRHLATPVNWQQPDIGSIRFVDTDVTPRVNRIARFRSVTAAAARRCVTNREPQIKVGQHCQQPFSCEFQASCQRQLDTPLLHTLPLS